MLFELFEKICSAVGKKKKKKMLFELLEKICSCKEKLCLGHSYCGIRCGNWSFHIIWTNLKT